MASATDVFYSHEQSVRDKALHHATRGALKEMEDAQQRRRRRERLAWYAANPSQWVREVRRRRAQSAWDKARTRRGRDGLPRAPRWSAPDVEGGVHTETAQLLAHMQRACACH